MTVTSLVQSKSLTLASVLFERRENLLLNGMLHFVIRLSQSRWKIRI